MTISPDGSRITDPTTTASGAENDRAGTSAPLTAPPPSSRPSFVSAQLAAVAGVAAMLLPIGAAFIPPPFNTLALILAFVAAYLAGVPGAVPTFLEGKPLVGKAAVPLLGTLSAGAGTFAESLQDGPAKFGAIAGALLLAWLAGKASPVPKS